MVESKKEIIIFGIGHLAKHLLPKLQTSFYITGLSRNFSCQPDKKIKYFTGNELTCNKTPEAIIINFPPSEKLLETLNSVNKYFDKQTPLIFVSSTSIYKEGEVKEDTELNKESCLFSCENFLQEINRPVTVVRPGGLFDSVRYPGNFFKNREEVSGATAPVNMVHCEDVASFIEHIINLRLYNENFNLVASTHPTKSEFYGKALRLAGNRQPMWIASKVKEKIVLNNKSCSTGFSYKYDDLLLSLEKL